LPTFLVGAVSVQMRHELHFAEARLGAAAAVFFLVATVTSAVLGRVAERLGPYRAMRLSAVTSAAVLLAIGATARTYATLLVLLAVGGAANALAQPAANVFIARTIPPARLGIAFALKQSGVPAATLLGGLAVPTIALTVGWRWAFVAGACGAVVGALATPADPRAAAAVATTEPSAVPAARAPAGRRDTSMVALVVLGAGIGLGAAAAGTLGAFLVNAAVAAGVGEGLSGLLVSVGSAIGIATRLVAGRLADRRGRGHLLRVAVMLALGAVAFATYATEKPLAMVLATPIAFGAGWGWPGLFNLAVVRANPSAPGVASGITQTGTYFGGALGPFLFGAVAERASYSAAWLLAAALALLGAIVITLGRALLRRERDRALAASPIAI
jgi:MFS family permease